MILIWSLVILWHSSILVISLNILFVSARRLHKYRILLIAKNTFLFKSFTSKNEMLSDVIVKVFFKCILLNKCELSTGLPRRNGLLYVNHMTFKEKNNFCGIVFENFYINYNVYFKDFLLKFPTICSLYCYKN